VEQLLIRSGKWSNRIGVKHGYGFTGNDNRYFPSERIEGWINRARR
jgi:hypothetical protein